jgi:hypothetical protein
LIYEVTLKSVLTEIKERILGLIHRRIPTVEASKFLVHVTAKAINVHMPPETLNTEGIQQIKRGISQEIFKFFPEIQSVNYLEAFEAPTKITKPTVPDTKTV